MAQPAPVTPPVVAPLDCGCKPDCCTHKQTKVEARYDDCPLYDTCCDCKHAASFVPADGIVIPRGNIVFFTGNDVQYDAQGDGVMCDFAEVDIVDSGKGIAGLSLWKIDNTNSDTGATQLLTKGRLFSNCIEKNGATIPQLSAAGFDLQRIYK